MSESHSGSEAPLPPEPEDAARARWYGLLSRLYYGAPDPNLLAEIAREDSVQGEGPLAASWHALQVACRAAFPALVRQEYDAVFVGVGEAEVSPYLSGYAAPAAPDRYLVRLRDRLAGLGYGRRAGAFEYEDHISGISDVMRRLIEDRWTLQEQRQFFFEFAHPGIQPFCAAVRKAPSARFYGTVADLTLAFFELDRTAFEMVDTAGDDR